MQMYAVPYCEAASKMKMDLEKEKINKKAKRKLRILNMCPRLRMLIMALIISINHKQYHLARSSTPTPHPASPALAAWGHVSN
jgi:hypothetical protein